MISQETSLVNYTTGLKIRPPPLPKILWQKNQQQKNSNYLIYYISLIKHSNPKKPQKPISIFKKGNPLLNVSFISSKNNLAFKLETLLLRAQQDLREKSLLRLWFI